MIDFDAAAGFIHRTARLLERHRFSQRFKGAGPEPVVRTLRAYRNADGGFGHALEPDLRDPASQPAATQAALEVLHEAGAREAELIDGACGFFTAIARADGGIPFCLPSAAAHPRGPWWQPADATSLTQTAANAAALHALGHEHPWLERADAYVWRRVEARDFLDSSYDVLFTIWFLGAVPDAARAEAALDALRPQLAGQLTLDHAPLPGSRARRLFEPAKVERELDALEAGQLDDGGWTFDFPAWAPGPEQEWRGIMTLRALVLLRDNGRL